MVAVGREARRFQLGDRVYAATGSGFGTHAQYLCLSEDAAIASMLENASFGEAVAISEGGLTALPFLRDVGRVTVGQRVLVSAQAADLGVLKGLMEIGNYRPLRDSTVAMTEVADAHRRVETGHKRGHVVLALE